MNSNYSVALKLCDFFNSFQKRRSSGQAELELESEVLLGFIFLQQTRACMLASNADAEDFGSGITEKRMCDERAGQ